MKKLLPLLLALILTLPAANQAWAKKKKHWDDEDGPPGQQFVPPGHRKKHKGPPDWAPAHGYREKQRYRYYPGYKIYHDPATGLFWSKQGGRWVQSSPPVGVTIEGLGRFHEFLGSGGEPWRYYRPR